MRHAMFDIDGTLIQSYDFDSGCFVAAVKDVIGTSIDQDWGHYKHVTDSGILNQIIKENGLHEQEVEVTNLVKSNFIQKIEAGLKEEPAREIPGASSFLAHLDKMNNIVVSFATGGWSESATLKLKSAGINFPNIPIASSNDHFSRTEIMKIAVTRTKSDCMIPITYFGDGEWDKKACQELGYNFVLVGERVRHNQKIEDYKLVNELMAYICA